MRNVSENASLLQIIATKEDRTRIKFAKTGKRANRIASRALSCGWNVEVKPHLSSIYIVGTDGQLFLVTKSINTCEAAIFVELWAAKNNVEDPGIFIWPAHTPLPEALQSKVTVLGCDD